MPDFMLTSSFYITAVIPNDRLNFVFLRFSGTMMKTFAYLVFIFIAVIMLATMPECTPEACFEETNAFVKASFYDSGSDTQLTPDSLTLYGTGMDTLKIYDADAGVKPALLPLDASESGCSFVIMINGVTDTLTFLYTSYPHLISKECGYTFYHNIEDLYYTENTIDHIYISKRNITTVNEENIRIFY